MSNFPIFSKPLFWLNLTVLILFGLLGANVIFGWTNPTANPPIPAGALYATGGNVGIGTTDLVSGARLTVNGRVSGLSTPIEGADAATKAYVDAASGGGGGAVTTLTLFGVTGYITGVTGVSGSPFRGPNGGVPPACRNNLSLCMTIVASWGLALGSGISGQWNATLPAPGTGAPACSTISSNLSSASSTPRTGDWVEIFAGYGPHETLVRSFKFGSQPAGFDPNNWFLEDASGDGNANPLEDSIPSAISSISDSVCSSSSYQHVAVTDTASGASASVNISSGLNSACSSLGCNTCRMCQWVPY